MVKCSASNCTSSSHKKTAGITFHRFPKDKKLRSAWLNNMKCQDWNPKSFNVLCSNHFEPRFLEPNKFCTRLGPGAIPTIFLEDYKEEENLPPPGQKIKTIATVLQEVQNTMNILPIPSKHELPQVIESLPGPSYMKLEELQCSRIKQYEKVIEKLKNRIVKKTKYIKALQQQKRRLKKKVSTFSNIISDLKSRLNHDDLHILSNIPIKNKELFVRYLKKAKNETLVKSFSPELRSFALQLHFYSPRAYNFVRSSFDTVLPHPGTLARRYKKVDIEPGFISESFNTLDAIIKTNKKKVFVSLIIDEMAVRKGLVWDSSKNRYKGYIDNGAGVEDDSLPLATQALVILVNGINCRFKLPIAFFFISSMTGEQRASIMKMALEMLFKINVFVSSITFDGAASNISMATHLGCKFGLNSLVPYFIFENTRINVFYDPCHMLKLIRNTLGDFKILVDKEGNQIRFEYFSLLLDLQKDKGLHLANKVRQAHIFFYKQKMKVRLASQLLSKSVADALTFCKDVLKIQSFNDCAATIKFVTVINDVFDVLNSRSTLAPGYKKALCSANIVITKELVTNCKDYLQNLKLMDGKLIVHSARKTGFIGFIICLESALNLFEDLIIKNGLRFVPLYSISQDHIEMFFGKMRARGGFNDNPNVVQLQSSLKKYIINTKISLQDNGFTIPNHILQTSSTAYQNVINDSTRSFERNIMEIEGIEDEELDLFLNSVLSSPLDEYTHHITVYIAGFIARKILIIVKCRLCHLLVLGKQENFMCSLINVKDRGGLIYPSDGLIKIVQKCEKIYKLYKDKSLSYDGMISYVAQSFDYELIFNTRNLEHITNHVFILTKLVVKKYIDLRCKHEAKVSNLSDRNYLKKIVLFKNK